MIYFNNDYSEGCHEKVLQALTRTNLEQTPGYGEDDYCAKAAEKIRKLCCREDLAVHFLVGGTQANLTVIDAALRPHQGALCALSGHINGHETGAVEATGHKVLTLPGREGKITADQVRRYVLAHRADSSFEHMVQPKLVYISTPSELGTLYTLQELEALSNVCRELGLYLFVDGARLGYGLAAAGNDVTLPDLARLCDVFYIGGTKVGALFGEAVVISNSAIAEDFRYLIKQHGGMLAKGRLLGLQFLALLDGEDGSGSSPYFALAAEADRQALQIRDAFAAKGLAAQYDAPANQQFFVLPDAWYDALAARYAMSPMGKPDAGHTTVRFCTSWATRPEAVAQLLADIAAL